MSDSNQHPKRHSLARAAIAAGLLATPLLLPSPAWAEEAASKRVDALPTVPVALAAPTVDDVDQPEAAAPDQDDWENDADEGEDAPDTDWGDEDGDLDENDDFWDDYDEFEDYDEDADLGDDDPAYDEDDPYDEGDDWEDPFACAEFEKTYVAPPGEPPAEPEAPVIPTTRRNPDGSKPQADQDDQQQDPNPDQDATPTDDGTKESLTPDEDPSDSPWFPEQGDHEPSTATEEEIEEARRELDERIKAAKEANEAYWQAKERLDKAVAHRQELIDEAARLIDALQERARQGGPEEVAQGLYALELSELLKDDSALETLATDGSSADYRDDLKTLHKLIGEYRSVDVDALYQEALKAHAHATDVYDDYLIAYDHYYDLLLWEDDWVPWPGYRYLYSATGMQMVPKDGAIAESSIGKPVSASASPRHMAPPADQGSAGQRLPETSDTTPTAGARLLAVLGSLLVSAGACMHRRRTGRHFAA